MIKIKIKRTSTNPDPIPLPSYAHDGDSGMDLRSDVDMEIGPGQRALVPCGFSMELPSGYEAQVRARSGLALKNGITVLNGIGTIDEGYLGPVGVILINTNPQNQTFADWHGPHGAFKIKRGDRIAQLVISPVTKAEWVETNDLTTTDRGDGGFGSTGIR